MITHLKTIASTAVFKAGEELLKRYYKYSRQDAKFKSAHEILTSADLASEKCLLQTIKKYFPEHQILSEEAGQNKKKSDYLWVLDPLDGTHNFSMHNPLWAVSLAVFYKQKLILGIVFAPVLNELYVAEKGVGAWLNGRRLQVSSFNDEHNINAFCHSSQIKDIKRALKYYNYEKLHSFDIRQFGSASLELAYVAAGRIESIAIPGANVWDVAAGVLLVREAGGRVTDFKDRAWDLKTKDMLATNSVAHSALIKVLKKI